MSEVTAKYKRANGEYRIFLMKHDGGVTHIQDFGFTDTETSAAQMVAVLNNCGQIDEAWELTRGAGGDQRV